MPTAARRELPAVNSRMWASALLTPRPGPSSSHRFHRPGGMGEFYRARNTRLNRAVAVKPAKHLASKSTPPHGCAMRPIPKHRQDRALFRHKSTGQNEHASRGKLQTGLTGLKNSGNKPNHFFNLLQP